MRRIWTWASIWAACLIGTPLAQPLRQAPAAEPALSTPAAAPAAATKGLAGPETKPAAAAAAKPQPTGEPKAEPKPQTKPAATPASAPKSAAKPEPRSQSKAPPKAEARPETRPASAPSSAPKAVGKAVVAALPASAPATRPAAKPAVAAAVPASAPASQPGGEGRKAFMRFQFDGMPYNDLVRLFAQRAGKPILGDFAIPGTLTFFDSEPYNYSDALDTINSLLAMRSFWLVEDARYFRVVPVATVPNEARIVSGMAEVEKARPGEVVTVMVPLKFLDATTASKAIVRMVSTWGSISPLARGKGLIITDSVANIRKVEEFLKLLDSERTADQQIETCPLKRASAHVVAEIISRLFTSVQQKHFERNPVTGAYEQIPMGPSAESVSATADDRTNSILLIGAGDRLAMAMEVINKLDSGGETGGDIRIFVLKNAKAEDIANTLTAAVGGVVIPTGEAGGRYGRFTPPPAAIGAQPVRIVADRATNRLIVAAPADKMTAIEQLIEKLDTASSAGGGVKIIHLKSADAQQLAAIVINAVARPAENGRMAPAVQVSSDPRTNTLILSGPEAEMQAATTLIDELDKETGKETREIHVVQLQAGDARQIAASLVRMFTQETATGGMGRRVSESTIRAEADSASNSIMISASPTDWPVVKKILDQLTQSIAPTATAVTRRIPLKAAKAEELAETLRQIYGGGKSGRGYSRYAASGGPGGYGAAAAAGPTPVPITIASDRNTNSLIISASEEDQTAIAELIKALDVASTETAEPVRLLHLASADAAKLAATLQAMLPPTPRGQAAEVAIYPDSATNTLLIRAPETQRKMIEEMVATLDKETKSLARETRVIPVVHISAGEVAAMVRDLYPGSPAAAGGGGYGAYGPGRPGRAAAVGGKEDSPDRVTITPAPGDRAVVVDAPKVKMEEIAQLIKSLDTEDAPGRIMVRTYDLTAAKAVEVATSLASLFAQQRSAAGRTRVPGETEPRFEASAASNQLLVAATAAQFAEIDKVIEKLQAATELASETRTFKLKFAKAADLAPVLQTMLADAPGAGGAGAGPRGRRAAAMGAAAFGAGAASGAAEGAVRVAALEDVNALVIQGPPAKLALAEKLITSFDVPEVAAQAAITILPLTNAKAEALVATLRNMLPPPTRGEAPEVYLEADKATNSVLLRAPEAQRKKIEEIVTQLDETTADQAREVRIIPLKHASAAAMVMTFSQLYTEGGTGAGGGYGSYGSNGAYGAARGRAAAGGKEGAEDRVILTPAPSDKAVVVEAPKTRIEDVAKLIASLDVEDAAGAVQVRTYALTNVKAAELADSLGRLFAQQQARPGRAGAGAGAAEVQPHFEADTTTNTLLVAATAAQFTEIDQLIEKLKAAAVLTAETRTFVLKFARASEIAGVLETMLADTPSGPGGPTGNFGRRRPSLSGAGGASGAMVRVAAVEAANAVVVQGPPEKLTLAEKLIQGFDTAQAAGQATIRIVPLENAQAESVAAKLQALLPPPAGGQEQQVLIQADPLTNSVLLRGPESERKMLEEMIAQLDKATKSQAREIRIVPVKKASAGELADMLSQLYVGGGAAAPAGPYGAGAAAGFGRFRRTRTITPAGDEAQRVIITAAPNDKALVIDAPKAKIDEIAAMVAKLDSEDSPSRLQVRTYQLTNGKAADLAASLSRMFGEDRRAARGRAGAPPEVEPRFDADPAANKLLVSATATQFEEIEKLIKDLQASAVVSSQTKTFPLKFARAGDLAEMLQTMLTEAPASGGVSAAAGGYGAYGASATYGPARAGRGGAAAGPAVEAVRVSVIEAANTLVIQGPPEKLALAEQLIKTFDTEQAAGQPVIEVVKLTNAQAGSLAEAINATLAARGSRGGAGRTRGGYGAAAGGGEQPVTVTPEPNSNSVLVRGPAAEVASVVEMIKRLDQQGDSSAAQVRVFKLENSSATELSKSIGTLFRDMVRQGGGRGAAAAEAVPFTVAADERTNSLVISTTAGYFKVVEQILKTLDQAGTLRDVQYIPLAHADAADVASKLDAMYGDRKGDSKPVIDADTLSNAISIVAKDADMRAMEEVVAKLDKSALREQRAIVRIVPLTNVRASQMADVIQRLYGQMSDAEVIVKDRLPTSLPGDGVKEDPNNILLPAIPPDPQAGSLFAPSQRPATRPAAGAASQPSAGSGQGPASRPFDEGPRPRVVIVPDRTSNSLVILAPRRELENIQTLIDKLTATGQEPEAEVRILKVQKADVSAVAQTLDGLFNPAVRAGLQAQAQVQAQARQRAARGQPPQPGAAPVQIPKPVITVVADVRTRSLIVRAKPADFDIIVPLVKHLDQVSTVVSEVRIFTLKTADAAEVATNLNELFNRQSRGGAGAQAPGGAGRRGGAAGAYGAGGPYDYYQQMFEITGAEGLTQVDASQGVAVSANRDTNSVVVTAPADAMKLIQKVIEELDQSTVTTRGVRMYPLKHADVATTVNALRDIFSLAGGATGAGAGPRGRGAGGAGASQAARELPAIITGDEVGRLVIVSATDEKHELIAKVIKEIDDAQAGGDVTIKVYRLEHADAQTMSGALMSALSSSSAAGAAAGGAGGAGRPRRPGGSAAGGMGASAGAGQLRISADPGSNSLVVRGSKEDHEKIAQLIEQMDQAPENKYPVRTIALKNADPGDLAAVLQGMFGTGAGAGGRARRAQGGPQAGAIIDADVKSHMLLIRADDDTFKKIGELVQKLDVVSSEAGVVKLYPLKNAEVATVVDAVQQIFADTGAAGAAARRARGTRGGPAAAGDVPVTVVGDEIARKVIVSAPEEKHTLIAKLITEIDASQTEEQVTVKVYRVENADATTIATALTNALSAGGAGVAARRGPPGAAGGAAGRPGMGQLRISPDASSNTLVVRASKEDHDKIAKLLTEMDLAPGGKFPVRTIALKNADAADVAASLNALFTGSGAGAAGRARRPGAGRGGAAGGPGAQTNVVIEADRGSRMILIRADDETFAKIQELVVKLDVSASTKAVPTLVAVEHAKAADLAPTLEAAFAASRGSRGGPEDLVTVVAEPLSNSLIVTASTENLEKIKALLAKLDTEGTGLAKTEFLILKNARATDLAPVLTDIAGAGGGAAAGGAGSAGRPRRPGSPAGAQGPAGVVVTADAASNALVVSGPQKDVERLMMMAAQLDDAAGATAVAVVKLYPVKNADVATMATALQQIFAGTGPAAAGGGAARGGAARPRAGGVGETPVTIIGDELGRKIIVSAAEDKHALIAKTITEIDESQAADDVTVKVYRLDNADATSTAPALLSALSSQAGAGGPRGAGGTGGPGQLRISADRSSNSLVVRASKADHERIAALLKDMDGAVADKYPVRSIPLNNADATDVAAVLNALFVTGGSASGGGAAGAARPRGGAGAAGGVGGKGSIVIEADRSTRMLLVRCDDVTFEKIRELAAKLDAVGAGKAARTLIALKSADAAAVATAITQAFTPQRGEKIAPEDIVSAVPEANSNSIIVTANEQNLAKVKDLLTKLDTEVTAERTELLMLKNARAVDLAPVLSQMAAGSGGGGAAGRARTGAAVAQVVTVSADAASNALVISGPSAKVDKILKMATELDKASVDAQPVVRIYEVKNADVLVVANSVTQMFAAAGGAARRPGAGAPAEAPVVVIPDEAARKVMVSAPADKHVLIAKVIKDIDDSQTADQVVVKVYKVENTDAASVATALTASLNASAVPRGGTGAAGGTGQPVRVSADRASNSLIVRAPLSEHQRVAQLLEEIDVSPTSKFPVRMIPLTTADPVAVAGVLNRLFGGAAAAAASGAGAAGRGRPAAPTGQEKVLIDADADSKMIVVRCDDVTFEKIRDLAAKLDVPTGKAVQTLLALKHAKADLVAGSLTQAFAVQRGSKPPNPDDNVLVVADPGTNSLIVTATTANLEKVKALLTQLDTETAGTRTEMVILKNGNATDMATMLTKLEASGAAAARRGTAGGGAPAPAVSISSDAASNALVISGPTSQVDEILQMAVQLDQAALATVSTVSIVPLKNGDAVSMAGMIRDLYNQQATAARQNRQTIPALAVTADERANALVVATTTEMQEKVAKWVEQMEQMKPARGTMRLIQLKNVDPSDVERAIQQIYNTPQGGAHGETGTRGPLGPARAVPAGAGRTEETAEDEDEDEDDYENSRTIPVFRGLGNSLPPSDAGKGIQGPPGPEGPRAPTGRTASGGGSGTASGGRVQTSVLDQQRSILVNASDEDYEAILKLAKALDDAAALTKQSVEVFVLTKADNVRVATALTSMYRPVIGRPARPEDQVIVTALAQTNAVVVSAAKSRMEEVGHLIEMLDKENVASPLEFRIYPLQNELPSRILPALTQMVTQIRKQRPDESIDVQADERTRSIIVTAKGTVFEQIDKIVKALDKAPPNAAAEVLVIPLKKADATRLAGVLTDMLRPSATTVVTPEARALQDQIRQLRIRGGLKEEVPELDLSKPIKVTSDPAQAGTQGSNSIIITSTPDNLKAMKVIVEMMDVFPLVEGAKVRLLHLQNADASSVSAILKDIFLQGRDLAGKMGTSVTGKAEPDSVSGKALVNPLNVTADLRTNTLVLSGLEETIAMAELIAKDLDRQEGKIVTEVHLFKLKNADATRLAPMLTAVFGEQVAATVGGAGGAAGGAVGGAEGLRTQVTRLRTALADKLPKESEYGKTRATLTIQADASTNVLIVAARSDVMPLIVDVIQTLDLPGASSLGIVRVYPLAHADATVVQTIVNNLHTGPNAALIRQEDRPTLAVDPRTNALVVSASEKTQTLIETLLKRLDAESPVDIHDVRLIPLINSDATTLAATLQKMMDARVQRLAALGTKESEALKMLILADTRSNGLIVGGGKEGFELVKSLALELDAAGPALAGQLQIVPLAHANAGTLATTLTNLFTQRYAAARTPDVQRQKPVILPDLRTNSLMVSAGADDTKLLTELLKKVDVEQTDPAVRLEVIPLLHNDASVVGPSIQQVFTARLTSMSTPGTPQVPQDRVDVTVDSLSNSLIVSASKENMALVRSLLEKVDVEPAGITGLVRVYPLKNADATRVSTMLQGLVTQGIYKPGITSATKTPALAAREKISIAVDTRVNALIVSASPENLTIIDEMVKKIDESPDYTLYGEVRLYILKHADAVQLAPTLQKLFDAKRQADVAAGGTGRSMTVSVTADGRSNALLVAGSKESFTALEEMLKQLDTDQIVAATEFRVFPLAHATATNIQPTLTQLFTQRPSRGQVKDPVTVLADARANCLIVGATPTDMKLAETLIADLDKAEMGKGPATTSFVLQKADATAVAKTIQDLYRAQGATAASSITVSVDERTNTVVVSAGPEDIKRIGELIEQLDKEQLTSVTELRVFPLNLADATELATLLTNMLTNKPKPMTAVSPNRQTLLQFISKTEDGKELIATALQEGVLITPDRRSNSLVVAAPVRNMPLLESLIHALDSTSPRMAEIRMFTLINADAQRMSDLLTQLFRLTAAGGASANPKAVNYTLVTTQPSGGPAPSATVGSAEQDTLSVTVDLRTNSLLIGGTTRYVDLAAKVIEELDSSPAQERMTKVYRLRNAQATDIQTALRSFLDQEKQRISSVITANALGSAQRLLEQEVAVVAEKTSNTLLLSASPRYFSVIEEMVDELDQPPSQVLIQVLLAELTLDQTDDLGLEWNMTSHLYGSKQIKYGTNFGVAANTSGFSMAVTAGDLNLFLEALESQGRLEVLSRPQILGSDNQLATINVGQQVPFITNSQITDTGSTINTIQYQDVGIILKVTPRINPDGFVKMDVNPEISALATSSVQITATTSAIVINKRSAQTTVNVQDGHTIVIGGLITTNDDHRENKVPWFGDIPVLGLLFGTLHKDKTRTELLIVLTPHILRTPQDSDAQANEELGRVNKLHSLSRQDVEEYLKKHLDEILKQEFNASASQPSKRTPFRAIKHPGPPTRPATTQPIGRLDMPKQKIFLADDGAGSGAAAAAATATAAAPARASVRATAPAPVPVPVVVPAAASVPAIARIAASINTNAADNARASADATAQAEDRYR